MSNPKIFKPSDVTEDVIESICDAVGMGYGAWDCVPPEEIVAAAWNQIPNDNDK